MVASEGESFDPAGASASTSAQAAAGPGPVRAAKAREVVHRCLAAQARRFPDLGIAAPDVLGLEPRDAALAHAIYDAVVRRWLTLTVLLETRLSNPLASLEPKLQAVLLSGAAQIFLFDRLPDHAVINESVEWAKRAIRPGAGAMVNAVLRRLAGLRAPGLRRPTWAGGRDEIPLSDGSALVLTEEAMPAEPGACLAAATSHPRQLIERWTAAFGSQEARRLALHGLVNPPIIVNTRHAASSLPSEHLTLHADAGHHVFTGGRPDLLALLASRSDLWVQDPASSAAVLGARHLRPTVIADVCAGQGTKTRQLAAVFPDAQIVATDTDRARLKVLGAAFAGKDQIAVTSRELMARDWAGRVDLVLLDVPCSNTGVLARRAEARYRAVDSLERLAATQKQIIADAIPLLAPGGAILYSTCSLEADENDAQAAWAKRWHHYRIRVAGAKRPAGEPGGAARDYTDGSFSCLLESA